MKKAFTMIELIFVMVVLAIVSTIGTDILRSIFNTYATTAQTINLEMRANNAVDVIASRLEKRVMQTTAVETTTTSGGRPTSSYIALANASTTDGNLIFYRKAHELERAFATWQKDPTSTGNRSSGYITSINSTTELRTSKYNDTITLGIKGSDLKVDGYELFFSADDGLIYKEAGKQFEPYYDQSSSAKQNFAYKCSGDTIAFKNETLTISRTGCPASSSTITRPSMAVLSHKILLSKEVNRLRLEDKTLYLDICEPHKRCAKSNNILANSVSSFRFTTLSSDENIATGITIKLCLKEGDAEVCQTRIVQ